MDFRGVPPGGMAHVIDDGLEVSAPEKGNGAEAFTLAENVPGDGLALPACHDPMLDSKSLVRPRVGPGSNIAAREHIRRGCFEISIHHDAIRGGDSGRPRQIDGW